MIDTKTQKASSTGGVINFFPWGLRHTAGKNFSGKGIVDSTKQSVVKKPHSKKP